MRFGAVVVVFAVVAAFLSEEDEEDAEMYRACDDIRQAELEITVESVRLFVFTSFIHVFFPFILSFCLSVFLFFLYVGVAL